MLGSAFALCRRVFGTIPLSWSELARRTWREVVDDDVLGLAAQLSYYFFLALFPAILFLLAHRELLSSLEHHGRCRPFLGPFVSPQVLELIQEQMRRLANNENGGLLTFGVAGALWSSSAALVSIVGALNRAYDIDEGRPWWKVRLVAIGLTLGVALIVLVALSLVLVGPTLAEKLGQTTGWGAPFEWTWLVLQWPLGLRAGRDGHRAHLLLRSGRGAGLGVDHAGRGGGHNSLAVGIPALQAVRRQLHGLRRLLRRGRRRHRRPALVLRLGYRHPRGRGTERRNRTRVSVRESPGQKNAQGKLLIGARAARAFRERQSLGDREPVTPAPSTQQPPPKPALGVAVAGAILTARWWNRRGDSGKPKQAAPTS